MKIVNLMALKSCAGTESVMTVGLDEAAVAQGK